MSLPGLKSSMFPNPWARSPELLPSPSYSSSHFQQSHWSEGAPREQIQEGRGGIILDVHRSTKRRPISDGGRTSRRFGQFHPSTDFMETDHLSISMFSFLLLRLHLAAFLQVRHASITAMITEIPHAETGIIMVQGRC